LTGFFDLLLSSADLPAFIKKVIALHGVDDGKESAKGRRGKTKKKGKVSLEFDIIKINMGLIEFVLKLNTSSVAGGRIGISGDVEWEGIALTPGDTHLPKRFEFPY